VFQFRFQKPKLELSFLHSSTNNKQQEQQEQECSASKMLGLFFNIGCLVAAPTAKADSWKTLQEVPHNGIGVQGMGAGVVGDKIIAALGLDW
jgi:hypothetical protein